jgi:arylsulfatase A-like enzyme
MKEAITLAAATLLLGSACPGETSKDSAPRNVLLIISDDLNTDFGVYGHKVVKTPTLDRLATESVVFDNAYCQFAVCNPSRASFLSGLRPENTGIIDNKTSLAATRPDISTLPRYLRENGYFTASTGKVFHDHHTDDRQGWDVVRNTKIDVKAQPYVEGRVLSDKVHFLEWRSLEGGDDSFFDGLAARNAVDLIREAKEENKPFFIAVGFVRPHDPFFAPKEYFDMYPLESLKLPEKEDVSGLPDQAWPIGKWKAIYDTFNEQDKLELLRSYYAGITYMDRQVGKVLEALDQNGFADNTLVVFLGDHGYHTWDKDWWGKATQFERSALSPLLVRLPDGTSAGQRTSGLVEFLDIYPTIVDWCGLTPPPHLDGKSFLPLAEKPDQSWKPAAYTDLGPYARTVRTDRWRYVEWYTPKPPFRMVANALYDHETDPGETVNLVDRPEQAAQVAELKTLLASNWKTHSLPKPPAEAD